MTHQSTQCPRRQSRSCAESEADELPLLTVLDVARLLAVPKSTVYRLVRRRHLATVRLGRYFRFQRSAVRDCINQRRCDDDQQR